MNIGSDLAESGIISISGEARNFGTHVSNNLSLEKFYNNLNSTTTRQQSLTYNLTLLSHHGWKKCDTGGTVADTLACKCIWNSLEVMNE